MVIKEFKLLEKMILILSISFFLYYAYRVLINPTISPEIGMAYETLTHIKSFRDVLAKFLSFNEEWYRPFTFYFTNYLIFNVIDIRNIFAIKALGIFMIAILAWLATIVAKKILNASILERLILFSLLISHPSYFIIAYDGSGITDPFMNIFLMLFILCFLPLVSKDDISKAKKFILTLSSVALIFLCLTTQERGSAIFIVLTILIIAPEGVFNGWRERINRTPVLVIGISALAFLIPYFFFVYMGKQGWKGPDYRTEIEPQYIFTNLFRMIEIPLRLMVYPINKLYDVHLNFRFNIAAFPFIMALAMYFFKLIREKKVKFSNFYKCSLLVYLYIACSVVPVFFGGNVWHFYTSSIFLTMLVAHAIYVMIFQASFIKNYLAFLLSLIFFIWLAFSIHFGLLEEVGNSSSKGVMQIMSMTLKDESVRNLQYTESNFIYFDTGAYGDNIWAFGGKGNIFKYVYQNPTLVEIPVSSDKILSGYEKLCEKTRNLNPIFLRFNAHKFSWESDVPKNFCQHPDFNISN